MLWIFHYTSYVRNVYCSKIIGDYGGSLPNYCSRNNQWRIVMSECAPNKPFLLPVLITADDLYPTAFLIHKE